MDGEPFLIAKLNNFQKSKKTWIELTPPKLFFGNPSLTLTEHSNHNNQQHLAMYAQTEYTWYTTPKYQYWFWAILGRFSTKKLQVRPTSIVISDFWNFFFAKPLTYLMRQHVQFVFLQVQHAKLRQVAYTRRQPLKRNSR